MTTTKKQLDVLSPSEVAELRGVSRQAVYGWLKRGLKCKKDRFGRVFVSRHDAELFQPCKPGWSTGRIRKITSGNLRTARTMRDRGASYAEIGKRLNVSATAIWVALNKGEANGVA